jgi:hypothetical protein
MQPIHVYVSVTVFYGVIFPSWTSAATASIDHGTNTSLSSRQARWMEFHADLRTFIAPNDCTYISYCHSRRNLRLIQSQLSPASHHPAPIKMSSYQVVIHIEASPTISWP